MNDIIFKIVQLAVVILAAVIGRYAIPYLKLSIGEDKFAQATYWIVTFVKAAEMLFGEKTGEEKLNYVVENVVNKLNELGVKLTDKELRALIEDAVYTYTHSSVLTKED